VTPPHLEPPRHPSHAGERDNSPHTRSAASFQTCEENQLLPFQLSQNDSRAHSGEESPPGVGRMGDPVPPMGYLQFCSPLPQLVGRGMQPVLWGGRSVCTGRMQCALGGCRICTGMMQCALGGCSVLTQCMAHAQFTLDTLLGLLLSVTTVPVDQRLLEVASVAAACQAGSSSLLPACERRKEEENLAWILPAFLERFRSLASEGSAWSWSCLRAPGCPTGSQGPPSHPHPGSQPTGNPRVTELPHSQDQPPSAAPLPPPAHCPVPPTPDPPAPTTGRRSHHSTGTGPAPPSNSTA